jgi:hypothetical protein
MDTPPHALKLHILALKEVPKPTTFEVFETYENHTTTGTLAWRTAVRENENARSHTQFKIYPHNEIAMCTTMPRVTRKKYTTSSIHYAIHL